MHVPDIVHVKCKIASISCKTLTEVHGLHGRIHTKQLLALTLFHHWPTL